MARGSHAWANKPCEIYADYFYWFRMKYNHRLKNKSYADYSERNTYLCGKPFGTCPNYRGCSHYPEGAKVLGKLIADAIWKEETEKAARMVHQRIIQNGN